MNISVPPDFNPKNMLFRRLGRSGLRVPLFSFGGWMSIGGAAVGDAAKDLIQTAYENGINMFDTAETYQDGQSEIEMGRVLKELAYPRSDLIIITKIYWGVRFGPNHTGLSRKHIIEGTKASLDRLQMDYVDVIFAHRPDPTVPMEEVVRAFNWVINKGWAFYWGTSHWSAVEIEEAWHFADKLGLAGPIAEQSMHNMFHRDRVDKEYAPLYKRYGMSTTVWSALGGGLLTGKYNDGIPIGSRFNVDPSIYTSVAESLTQDEGIEKIRKLKALATVAEGLDTSMTALALAWVAKSPNTGTIILGASRPEQIVDNIRAIEVIPKLTPDIMQKIEDILENKPGLPASYGRPALDVAERW